MAISTTEHAHRFDQRQIPVSNLNNPKFQEVLGIWSALRGQSIAPAWNTADLLKYPTSVIPYISVVDVLPDGEFRYRFWGTGHSDVKGYDYTGQSPRDHEPQEYGHMIHDDYEQVVNQAEPVAFVHDIRPEISHAPKFQETLRLPLSNDGKNVTGVISFADWHTNADHWVDFFEVATGAAD